MLSCEPARAFASLVTRRLPLRAPPACGVKLTPIEHDCPGSSTGGQCELALKSPVARMRAIVKGPSPRFVSVAVCWAAVAPTCWLKLSRAGVSCTRAMVRMAVTGIRWGLFFFQAEDGIRARNVTGVQTSDLDPSHGWTHHSIARRYGARQRE